MLHIHLEDFRKMYDRYDVIFLLVLSLLCKLLSPAVL